MDQIPPLEGLGWSKVRAVAKELAATGTPDEVAAVAGRELGAEDTRRRMLAIYLLGFTAGARPAEAIRRLAALRADESEYVRHSAGNALRDIRRAHPELVDAETATWDMNDPRVRFTHERVLKAR